MRYFKQFNNLVCAARKQSVNQLLTFQNQRYSSCYSSCKLVCSDKSFFSISNDLQKNNSLDHRLVSRNFSTSELSFSKSKDRGGKEKKKPKAAKIDLRELSEIFDVDNFTSQMQSSIESMKSDFIKNLTIRSTTGSLEQIPVTLDGKDYQLQELAQIAKKPKLLVLNVAAFPTAIPHILKAIEKSGLNINPQQDGTTIFLPIPKVTKEHRENLSKNAKAIFIRYRDEIKDTRNKALKNLKKKKDVSEDVLRRVQSQIEALCDKYLKEAEIVLDTKQNELLSGL